MVTRIPAAALSMAALAVAAEHAPSRAGLTLVWLARPG